MEILFISLIVIISIIAIIINKSLSNAKNKVESVIEKCKKLREEVENFKTIDKSQRRIIKDLGRDVFSRDNEILILEEKVKKIKKSKKTKKTKK